MKDLELLKYIDNRLDELIKYYHVLDERYKLNVLTDLKNKVKGEIKNENI